MEIVPLQLKFSFFKKFTMVYNWKIKTLMSICTADTDYNVLRDYRKPDAQLIG